MPKPTKSDKSPPPKEVPTRDTRDNPAPTPDTNTRDEVEQVRPNLRR